MPKPTDLSCNGRKCTTSDTLLDIPTTSDVVLTPVPPSTSTISSEPAPTDAAAPTTTPAAAPISLLVEPASSSSTVEPLPQSTINPPLSTVADIASTIASQTITGTPKPSTGADIPSLQQPTQGQVSTTPYQIIVGLTSLTQSSVVAASTSGSATSGVLLSSAGSSPTPEGSSPTPAGQSSNNGTPKTLGVAVGIVVAAVIIFASALIAWFLLKRRRCRGRPDTPVPFPLEKSAPNKGGPFVSGSPANAGSNNGTKGYRQDEPAQQTPLSTATSHGPRSTNLSGSWSLFPSHPGTPRIYSSTAPVLSHKKLTGFSDPFADPNDIGQQQPGNRVPTVQNPFADPTTRYEAQAQVRQEHHLSLPESSFAGSDFDESDHLVGLFEDGAGPTHAREGSIGSSVVIVLPGRSSAGSSLLIPESLQIATPARLKGTDRSRIKSHPFDLETDVESLPAVMHPVV